MLPDSALLTDGYSSLLRAQRGAKKRGRWAALMTRVAVSIAISLSLFLPTAGAAADCGALPVKTADQAICRAREFAEKQKPAPRDLEFKALETPVHWVVYYGPKSTTVRGGGADLMVEKKTGAVTLLRSQR